jgi:dTDP-glucose 4,6-dehydratase
MGHRPANLLVTGGAGFIGSNFVHYWLSEHGDNRVVVLDALTYAGNMESLSTVMDNPSFRFVHGDIRDYDLVAAILVEEKIDTIVHFAAESHVDRSIHGPDEFLDTNINGTHILLKAARRIWLEESGLHDHRFHHVSTDEVYGSLQPDDPPFRETNSYAPNSPYAASKAASDHIVRAYHKTYGLDVTTSNCSNNYGPYQFPEKLVPMTVTNILAGKPLPVYGDGMQIRDWLHVDDHNRGIDLVIRQGEAGETYNIGGENEKTNIRIFRLVCRLVDEKFARDSSLAQRFPHAPPARGGRSEELMTHVADRPGHDRRYAIDASKIKTSLGYRPMISFEAGMKSTIDWFLENEQWWKNVMDGSYREWIRKNYQGR